MKIRIALLLLVATSLVGAEVVTALPSSGVIDVLVKEWKLDMTSTTHTAGKITFNLDSRGTILHEVVIIKTDKLARDLVAEINPTTLRLDEESFDSPGEYGDLPAGNTVVFTIDLSPGHYVVMCNIEAHYGAGMYSDLTIVRP